MFGYVVPDKLNMYMKDYNLFKAYYCGLCKTLGKMGLPHTRFATNYDCTFLNVLLHTLTDTKIEMDMKPCILNPFQKKAYVKADDLSNKVADVSVLLVYYNADDDVKDGQKSRALIKAAFMMRKRAAKKRFPEVDRMMKISFDRLNKLEKEKSADIDEVCDTFAGLLKDIVAYFVPDAPEQALDLAYNLGRLVYLFDAVDDLQKDFEKGKYNPILQMFMDFTNKTQFLTEHNDDLSFLLKSCYNKLVSSYNEMSVTLNEGVLSNIIYLGLPMQIDRLLKGEEKCPTTRL